MMANRHALPDQEMTLQIPHIDPVMKAGTYIRNLDIPGDRPVFVNSIISAVHFDFVLQRTTVSLATIR